MTPTKRPAPGTWASQHTPRWCFNLFDISERMGVSVRHVRRLIVKHHIQTGKVRRPVRLPSGIKMRSLVIVSPSSMEELLTRHAGLPTHDLPPRTP